MFDSFQIFSAASKYSTSTKPNVVKTNILYEEAWGIFVNFDSGFL